ncbi:hypothetical protein [Nostoc sp. TCL26-01]|uniref:hypothetical protein n=1 Tax=Nostoc sp. TCL26-01 TaxID=2576904 RepID=UPI002119B2DA|nr:hypothetical protein [Nostoc sp. TCL26-01]
MALPIYFYNAGVNLVSNDLSSLTNRILSVSSIVEHRQTWRISARDEQTGDCLRQRRCKD